MNCKTYFFSRSFHQPLKQLTELLNPLKTSTITATFPMDLEHYTLTP
jgi:hypothetical protein